MATEKWLIDANVFADHLECMARTTYPNLLPGLLEAAEYARDFLPTVDAVEVVHGRWEDYGAGVCCSACGLSLFHQDQSNNWGIEPSGFNYCPNCGAKMDLKGE